MYTVIGGDDMNRKTELEPEGSDVSSLLDESKPPDQPMDHIASISNRLRVDLRCRVFDSILSDLELDQTVGYIRNLALDFTMTSPKIALHLQSLIDNLQYSLSSLFLNLEFKYPFVFSYYGRQLIQLNYKALTRSMAMLATSLEDSEVSELMSVVPIALGKLQRAILTEFNTLNVMKECDFNYHRSKLCRQFENLNIADDSRRSIKSKGFKLLVFEEVDHV